MNSLLQLMLIFGAIAVALSMVAFCIAVLWPIAKAMFTKAPKYTRYEDLIKKWEEKQRNEKSK